MSPLLRNPINRPTITPSMRRWTLLPGAVGVASNSWNVCSCVGSEHASTAAVVARSLMSASVLENLRALHRDVAVGLDLNLAAALHRDFLPLDHDRPVFLHRDAGV